MFANYKVLTEVIVYYLWALLFPNIRMSYKTSPAMETLTYWSKILKNKSLLQFENLFTSLSQCLWKSNEIVPAKCKPRTYWGLQEPWILNLGPWIQGSSWVIGKELQMCNILLLNSLISPFELWKSRVCLHLQMGMFEFILVAIESKHYISLTTEFIPDSVHI